MNTEVTASASPPPDMEGMDVDMTEERDESERSQKRGRFVPTSDATEGAAADDPKLPPHQPEVVDEEVAELCNEIESASVLVATKLPETTAQHFEKLQALVSTTMNVKVLFKVMDSLIQFFTDQLKSVLVSNALKKVQASLITSLQEKIQLAMRRGDAGWLLTVTEAFNTVSYAETEFEPLQMLASVHLETLEGNKQAQQEDPSLRLVTPDYGTTNHELHSTFDRNRFVDQVVALFDWFKDEKIRKKYMAPYKPMIQSSGMGKTMLLYHAKKAINILPDRQHKCFMIQCTSVVQKSILDKRKDEESNLKVYDSNVALPIYSDGMSTKELERHRFDLCSTLDDYVQEVEKGFSAATVHPRIVLFFDDVEHLLKFDDGFLFRAVRWWLRKKRNVHIVAVFAGTSCSIMNYYKEGKLSTSSRRLGEAELYYNDGGEHLYSPFYGLHTIGCLSHKVTDKVNVKFSEYERAVLYGRPLFARLQLDKKLTELEYQILMKITLGHSEYWSDLSACLSVLATRIQMGQTSIRLASKLVSQGYAALTMCTVDNEHGQHVQVCHFPDPVCARLAMQLMNGGQLSYGKQLVHCLTKTRWSEKVQQIFSCGLCRPFTGDAGELFAALYLLFCGDVLRHKQDETYKKFSVSMSDWISILINNGSDANGAPQSHHPQTKGKSPCHLQLEQHPQIKRKSPCRLQLEQQEGVVEEHQEEEEREKRQEGQEHQETGQHGKEPLVGEINFIQVCQNYTRLGIQDLLHPSNLQHMYASGTAYYAFQRHPIIDMFGAIRLHGKEEDKEYAPLLVSVKARSNSVGEEQIGLWFDDMCDMMKNANHIYGLCLLVLIGSDTNIESYNSASYTGTESGQIDCVLVNIRNDVFGVANAFHETTFDREDSTEMFTSHAFMRGHSEALRDSETSLSVATSALRKAANKVTKQYMETFVQSCRKVQKHK